MTTGWTDGEPLPSLLCGENILKSTFETLLTLRQDEVADLRADPPVTVHQPFLVLPYPPDSIPVSMPLQRPFMYTHS